MSYQSKHTGATIDNAITDMQSLQSIILNTVYPVGSYYISSDSTNPSTKFGGTWEQITDRMIMAAGSTYSAGTSGGAANHTHTSAAHTHMTAEHTLTVNEIPSHTHGMTLNNYSSNNYTGGFKWEYAKSGYFKGGSAYILYEGGGASHNHGNTGSTTPGNTGSSSNLPPYIVAYVWRRTA